MAPNVLEYHVEFTPVKWRGKGGCTDNVRGMICEERERQTDRQIDRQTEDRQTERGECNLIFKFVFLY